MDQLNVKVGQRSSHPDSPVFFEDDGWDSPELQAQSEIERMVNCCEEDCGDGCECDQGNGCGCENCGCGDDGEDELPPETALPDSRRQPRVVVYEKHKECIERSQPTGCNDETGSYRKWTITVKIVKRY